MVCKAVVGSDTGLKLLENNQAKLQIGLAYKFKASVKYRKRTA